MANRLINETSPYLLQHAENPVDWYPWGEEALARSKDEDKPILLSIGYSACHWCHVMERESFEDDAIASLMNANFVNIKVDREERPDLDAVYMEAVQMLTGSGGWPMTVFLTPEGKPFYGGTYYPPTDRMNMPGFPRVLLAVTEAYRTNRGEVERVTGQLTEQMGRTGQLPPGSNLLSVDILHEAYSKLAANFDYQNGGIRGGAQVSAANDAGVSAALLPPWLQPAGAGYGGDDAGEDGLWGYVRPAGWRVPPLFHGRLLAGAALREDAV